MTLQSRKSRGGRSVLLVVALLLVGSAMVRALAGGGLAFASGIATAPAPQATSPDPDIMPELLEILASVRQRESDLDERTAALEARMQVLARAEQEIATDLKDLESAEARLRATIADANSAAENDIVKLTSVYENMKAEQAAELFSRMEPSFAAGFLGRMRADAAAEILAGLEPDMAYSISVILAGRNADVPVQHIGE